MEYTQGQVVYSKSGRDKTLPFIVVAADGDYLYLVDGKLRTLQHPKKKNIKHVQKTLFICYNIKEKLENNSYLLDSDIRSGLKEFGQKEI